MTAPSPLRGLSKIDGQTRIIELPVVVDHATRQAVGFNGRDNLNGFGFAQDPRWLEPQLSRELIVHLHADSVEGALPPFVIWNNEGHVVNEMRRILGEAAPLAKRLQHEGYVSLSQIAYATVNKLRRPARRSFCEIYLFEQCHRVASCRGVHCRPQSCCPASNDDDVEWGFR